TIENGDVPPRAAGVRPILDALDDELGLVAFVERRVQPDRIALRTTGPEVLAQAAAVVRDQRVRRVEDRRRRAIVLLQANELRTGEIAAELREVLHARTTPAVDRLIVVTHDERRALRTGHELHPAVLNGVRVLELIDEHVTEAVLVLRMSCSGTNLS